MYLAAPRMSLVCFEEGNATVDAIVIVPWHPLTSTVPPVGGMAAMAAFIPASEQGVFRAIHGDDAIQTGNANRVKRGPGWGAGQNRDRKLLDFLRPGLNRKGCQA